MSKSYYWQHEDDGVSPHGGETDSGSEDVTLPSKPKGRPADTLIIFDWDDTLLCSSAINAQQWTPLQLQQLERTVDSILHAAMRLGETMIVTNGNETWVQDSTRRFFPSLQPTLDKLKVMSARHGYEQSYPGDPFSWKRQAFKEIMAQRRGRIPGCTGINLIAIGDSPAEIQAARSCTKVLSGRSLVKTVKFKEAPTVNELLGQLRRVLQELGKIVSEDCNISRGLMQRPLPAHLDHLASWASGWRFAETEYAPTAAAKIDNLSWILHALA